MRWFETPISRIRGSPPDIHPSPPLSLRLIPVPERLILPVSRLGLLPQGLISTEQCLDPVVRVSIYLSWDLMLLPEGLVPTLQRLVSLPSRHQEPAWETGASRR
jgi:hypothetical protein